MTLLLLLLLPLLVGLLLPLLPPPCGLWLTTGSPKSLVNLQQSLYRESTIALLHFKKSPPIWRAANE